MRAPRSILRLARCLLAYILIVSLLTPPSWQSAASPAASPGGDKNDAPSRGGELLVRFGADPTERGKDDVASSKRMRRKGKLRGGSAVERLGVELGQDLASAAERLRRQPGVEFAEPNFLVGHNQVTPNDVRFPEQWSLRNAGQGGGSANSDVRATTAWQETAGLCCRNCSSAIMRSPAHSTRCRNNTLETS